MFMHTLCKGENMQIVNIDAAYIWSNKGQHVYIYFAILTQPPQVSLQCQTNPWLITLQSYRAFYSALLQLHHCPLLG